MNFTVKWTSKANKIFNKLPKSIAIRILNKVDEIKINPFHYLEHYEGQNLYKLRIGDYRALIEVIHKEKILVVRVLDKRGRIYKR